MCMRVRSFHFIFLGRARGGLGVCLKLVHVCVCARVCVCGYIRYKLAGPTNQLLGRVRTLEAMRSWSRTPAHVHLPVFSAHALFVCCERLCVFPRAGKLREAAFGSAVCRSNPNYFRGEKKSHTTALLSLPVKNTLRTRGRDTFNSNLLTP